MCGCEDGDQPKVFERTLRQSRRDHRCCECQRMVARGAWYEEVSGLWGDSWDSFRTCTSCVARREAWNVVECHPLFGQMRETIVECLVARDYDRGIGRMRRHIDRKVGSHYMRELRESRARMIADISERQQKRAKRYSNASRAREQRRRDQASIGGGI